MTGPEHNPRDDEQDEEELFVLVIAKLVQAGKISMAKIHLRSYIDYVNKSIAYGRESERAGKERGMSERCGHLTLSGFNCMRPRGHEGEHDFRVSPDTPRTYTESELAAERAYSSLNKDQEKFRALLKRLSELADKMGQRTPQAVRHRARQTGKETGRRMKLFVEFESGNRSMADLRFGQKIQVRDSSPIYVNVIAFDPRRQIWLYAESLNGPWHCFDGQELNKLNYHDDSGRF